MRKPPRIWDFISRSSDAKKRRKNRKQYRMSARVCQNADPARVDLAPRKEGLGTLSLDSEAP